MGGKTWSVDEERYFWEVIVPQSQQAVRPSDRVHPWDTLATMMQNAMGEPRRRDYTRTMLYEHYYQNIKTGSHSPKAKLYVRKHKADLKAEREQSESVVASSPSLTVSPAVSTRASRESHPTSALGRDPSTSQSIITRESYERPTHQVSLPRETPYTASPSSQSPPLSYSRRSFHRPPLARSPLPPPPPAYPRVPTAYEPQVSPPILLGSPPCLKRRAGEADVDAGVEPIKRQQLSPLEPAAYPQYQYSMAPNTHIRQASEEWLRQLQPPLRSHATPPQHPRLSLPPRLDASSSMRDEPVRPQFERPATVLGTSEGAAGPPEDVSRLDTLVWASRVHSHVAESNEHSITSSETNSRGRSRSASNTTNTPDGSNTDNGEAGNQEDDAAPHK